MNAVGVLDSRETMGNSNGGTTYEERRQRSSGHYLDWRYYQQQPCPMRSAQHLRFEYPMR